MITPQLKQLKQDIEVFQSNNDLICKGLNKSLFSTEIGVFLAGQIIFLT